LSATGSNGNENTAGSDPGEPRAHRVSGAGSAWDAAPGVWRPRASGSAGDDAVLDALLRARRDGSAPDSGVFALDAGPEPEPDDVPLRSRDGGVNKPRAAVPAPLPAAEAVRLVDIAHTKRARMVTAFGVPAVFLAATGVAVVPTVANAASSSSAPSAQTAANCAAGSKTMANPAAQPGATAPSSSAPSSAPSSSGPTKAGSAQAKPGVPLPTSAPSGAQPPAPSARPSSAPSGTTTPAKAAPTTAPTAPAPTSKSTAPAAPSSTPSPSSSATWWNPLSWLGTTVNGVFNPAPSSSSGNSTVNKLSTTPAADPASTPSPILSIGLGDSSSSPSNPSTPPSSKPSSDPTSKPSVPSTPQPSSSGSSAPGKAPSSSAPSTNPSGPVVVNGTTLPAAPATVCVAAADPGALREVEWHLDASSLTLVHQHFDGFHDIQTGDGKTVTVMFVHAASIQLTDMVTYNEDGGKRVYSNGGKGKTVTLTNVELHVLQQKGTVIAPLPLGPVTLGPPGEAGGGLSQVAMLALESNIDLGPTIMTDVHVDQYTMTSDTLNIPGFNVAPAA
jgi:hypothetical protein